MTSHPPHKTEIDTNPMIAITRECGFSHLKSLRDDKMGHSRPSPYCTSIVTHGYGCHIGHQCRTFLSFQKTLQHPPYYPGSLFLCDGCSRSSVCLDGTAPGRLVRPTLGYNREGASKEDWVIRDNCPECGRLFNVGWDLVGKGEGRQPTPGHHELSCSHAPTLPLWTETSHTLS